MAEMSNREAQEELMIALLSQGNLTISTVWRPQAVNGIQWNLLNEEKLRLSTYSKNPSVKSAILLAKAGFVCIGFGQGTNDYTMTCYFCCKYKNNWQASDKISVVHKDLCPQCPMVTGVGCNNVPMGFNGKIGSDSPNVPAQLDHQNGQHLLVLTTGNEVNVESTHDVPHLQNVSDADAETDIDDFPDSEQHTVTLPVHTQWTRSATPQAWATIENSQENAQQLLVPAAMSPSPAAVYSKVNEYKSSSHQNPPAVTVSGSLTAVNRSTSSCNEGHSTNPPQGRGISSPRATCEAQDTARAAGKSPTYAGLGSITEEHKGFGYNVRDNRIKLLQQWYNQHKHITKEGLADAGFYYTGHGESVVCFSCQGKITNWERVQDVWVEHARCFPKCAYVRQKRGQPFVNSVHILKREYDKITLEMVTKKTD